MIMRLYYEATESTESKLCRLGELDQINQKANSNFRTGTYGLIMMIND